MDTVVVRIVAVLFLVVIIYCLFSGLFHLIRDKGHGEKVVKALTWRISLSIALFVMLLLAYFFGLIAPNPFYP